MDLRQLASRTRVLLTADVSNGCGFVFQSKLLTIHNFGSLLNPTRRALQLESVSGHPTVPNGDYSLYEELLRPSSAKQKIFDRMIHRVPCNQNGLTE